MDFQAGDVVTVDFPGVTGIKRRPASVFRCFIVTLPPAANLVGVGQLSARDWQGVCDCVRLSFAPLIIAGEETDV